MLSASIPSYKSDEDDEKEKQKTAKGGQIRTADELKEFYKF